MTFHAPPIVKKAEQLLLEIEQAVRSFSGYHRQLGEKLRDQIQTVWQLAQQAYSEKEHRLGLVDQLTREVDLLRLKLQMAAMLRAFTSKARSEQLARLCQDLGKQAGGWKKDVHRSAQNDQPCPRCGQRGKILSTPAASASGANV